jgi:hypothetical protein
MKGGHKARPYQAYLNDRQHRSFDWAVALLQNSLLTGFAAVARGVRRKQSKLNKNPFHSREAL